MDQEVSEDQIDQNDVISLNLKAGIRNALVKAESLILKPSLKKGLFEEKPSLF